MATKFLEFIRGVEEEARAEGPEAVAELQALRDHFHQLATSSVAARKRSRSSRRSGS